MFYADVCSKRQVLINDRFAQFSEALYVADRHAREEVRQRSLMQQRIAQKEKEQKEENLRMLAQRAREERSGIVIPVKMAGASGGAMPAALAGYGSDSDESGTESEKEEADEDDEKGAREREEIRRERKKEREREMRMNNMGTEQRAKVLSRCVILFRCSCLSSLLTRLVVFSAAPLDEISPKKLHLVWPSPRCRRIRCWILVSSIKSN